jgi:KUP system potassium uptake protein
MLDSANGHAHEKYASQARHHESLRVLALGALGVVFGDIGTSPLYAFKLCMHAANDVGVDAIYGVLSLIFWAITLVVTVKYVVLVLRTDNRGEGGVLALTELVVTEGRARYPLILATLGLAGCAFFYGDGTITPAVSVLSAIEGLGIAYPEFAPAATPTVAASVMVLILLFMGQRQGTGQIGRLFGPVMLVWFVAIGVLGAAQIVRHPQVLAALSPGYAVMFLVHHSGIGLAILASVFLAVTGGEALYADLGHFGARPIRMVWYWLVWPMLTLNYFGQGALLVANPVAVDNPFYRLAPPLLLVPLVVLATAATIIASQAVISGVFSMTQQALQLGFLPRMKVMQTSAASIGQIYVPVMNWILCAVTLGLVIRFQTSDNLANAYGIAVVCTMFITTILEVQLLSGRAAVESQLRRSGAASSRVSFWLLLVALPLFLVDGLFVSANIGKIPNGGWFPLLAGLIAFMTMRSWMRGRAVVSEQLRRQERPVDVFIADLLAHPPQQVPGTAVFLSSNADAVPRTLIRNVRYNGVLHEHTVLVSVLTERIPRVPRGGRLKVAQLAPQLWRVEVHIGFMERADVPRLLREAERLGLGFRTDNATYFLGREDIIVASPRGMAKWRKRLFRFLAHNAEFAGAHFNIPPERIIELGGQVQI